jgi:hypothetical protein
LAFNYDLPDLCLPSSQDYKHEPLCPALSFTFLTNRTPISITFFAIKAYYFLIQEVWILRTKIIIKIHVGGIEWEDIQSGSLHELQKGNFFRE